jgi:HPt (histidine-containing phosphotransfer) domain-containing protein
VTSLPSSLNPVYLADIFEAGGEPLVREVTETFLTEAPRRLAVLYGAMAAEDWPGAAMAAHGIVSGASMLGLTDVAEAARRVEQLAGQHTAPPAAEVARLDAAVAAARGLLAAAIDRLVAR